MGQQIIVQPDGLLCVFSSVVDDLVLVDCTEQELEDYYADHAAHAERVRVRATIASLRAGDARRVYHRRALTYEQALKLAAAWRAAETGG